MDFMQVDNVTFVHYRKKNKQTKNNEIQRSIHVVSP